MPPRIAKIKDFLYFWPFPRCKDQVFFGVYRFMYPPPLRILTLFRHCMRSCKGMHFFQHILCVVYLGKSYDNNDFSNKKVLLESFILLSMPSSIILCNYAVISFWKKTFTREGQLNSQHPALQTDIIISQPHEAKRNSSFLYLAENAVTHATCIYILQHT